MVSVQHLLDQCRHRTTIVFGNLGRWPYRVTRQSILTPSFLNPTLVCTFVWKNRHCVYESFGSDTGVDLKFFRVSPSLGGASNYGSLPFGSHALHETGGRDVVGRLGNTSRREPTLACPQPWKRALETHVERSHQNALAHGMPSDVLEPI
ncbi:hypothetical protein TNCV_2263011 [Trichonephila clavipes]|nr:hypothetical protein TNCV_2263011 [Trichonephila clavipes]